MKYLTATVIFVVGELVGLLIFTAVKRAIGPPKSSPARKASLVKGMLERAGPHPEFIEVCLELCR